MNPFRRLTVEEIPTVGLFRVWGAQMGHWYGRLFYEAAGEVREELWPAIKVVASWAIVVPAAFFAPLMFAVTAPRARRRAKERLAAAKEQPDQT